MTREEAIEILKSNYPDACFEQLRDAVDTAISALKQSDVPDIDDGDMISRKAAIEKIEEIFPTGPNRSEYVEGIARGATKAKRYLEQLPSARPEIIRCRDCKYLGTVYTKRQGETWCFCSEIGTGTELNGWCWYGERREEDDRPD